MGIRRLARELHVSIGTVSRALNDRPDVNPETRARVKEAAERLGYVPNQSGRSLRSGRTGIVAAILPSTATSDVALLSVVDGMRRALHRRSLDLVILLRGPEEQPLDHLKRIVQRRIANSVVLSDTIPNDPRLSWLMEQGIRFVTLGRSAGIDGHRFVDFALEASATDIVRRFVADGHRRMALTMSEQASNAETVLLQSLRREASRIGIGAGAVAVIGMRRSGLSHSGHSLLAHPAEMPTAILISRESHVATLYSEFRVLRRQPGRDVSLVLLLQPFLAGGFSPSLSHLAADLDAAGAQLASALFAEPEHGPSCPLLPLRYIPGASSGPAPNRLITS